MPESQTKPTILGIEVDLDDPDAEDYLYVQTPLGGIWLCRTRADAVSHDKIWEWGWNFEERAPDDFDTLESDRHFSSREEAIVDADKSLRVIVKKVEMMRINAGSMIGGVSE